jgi:general secretion pathway protein G
MIQAGRAKQKNIFAFWIFKPTAQSRYLITNNNKGFSLIEMMIILAIIGVLSAVAIPNYMKYRQKAIIIAAISEIRIIGRLIDAYEMDTGRLPASLSELKFDNTDPWGNPYQYLNIQDADKKSKGKMRKDQFLVPVNSDYDLFSMGSDGQSVAPFTAKHSLDDIVRANNGGFVGLASDF